MKLNEIVGKEKAKDERDLIRSIKNGVFTKDGSDLITADFDCSAKNLLSLVGCPHKIGHSFYCQDNKLTSLEGCPQKVGDHFICHRNKLASLVGCPQEVNGNFSCSNNKLTSLKDVHKHVKKINGAFYVDHNPIKSHVLGLLKIEGCNSVLIANASVEKILNKYLPLGDLIDCQEELIEAGFPEYAQL